MRVDLIAPWARSDLGRQRRLLQRAAARRLHGSRAQPGDHDRLLGLEHIDKIVAIDQSPIGRTPRSNPATYTKVFDPIRAEWRLGRDISVNYMAFAIKEH